MFGFSCGQREVGNEFDYSSSQKAVAEGYAVPNDKLAPPEVIHVESSQLQVKPVGAPYVFPTTTRTQPSSAPDATDMGEPESATPGQAPFIFPRVIAIRDSLYQVGQPEITLSKEMARKEQNRAGFSYLSKLQGLKHNKVNCIMEDRSGNLWLGTDGGATKFDGRNFTHFTEKQGLSNNKVTCIIEDKSRNIWFGTAGGGAIRYDGSSFMQYDEQNGLSGNRVYGMWEDKLGNIWIATQGGLTEYNGTNLTQFSAKTGMGANDINCVFQDKAGQIWIGTHGGGVIKFHNKTFYKYTSAEGLTGAIVWAISEDRAGNIWFSTDDGAFRYDGNKCERFSERQCLMNGAVHAVLEDSKGYLWFATHGGGVSRSKNQQYAIFTENDGLISNNVSDVHEDRSGNIWFATDAGLARYDGMNFRYYSEAEGLSNNVVNCAIEDAKGNLWYGTNGGGVIKYDGHQFFNYTIQQGLLNNTVWSLEEDRKGNIWIGTDAGVCKFDGSNYTYLTTKEGLGNNSVYTIFEDIEGNIWFGTYGAGAVRYDGETLTRFEKKNGLCHNVVFSITQDKSGRMWFGTYGGGITSFDGNNFVMYSERHGLSSNLVLQVHYDHLGRLWIVTDGGGITMLENKNFHYYTEKLGLMNDVVTGVLEDRNGELWFGTRFGLCKSSVRKSENGVISDSSSLQFRNYGFEDGFVGGGCNRAAMLQSKDGTIWVGASDRLMAVDPLGLASDTVAPAIQLTALDIYNDKINWLEMAAHPDTSLTLSNGVSLERFEFAGLSRQNNVPENLSLRYNNNYITIRYSGITLNQPGQVKYVYKLKGIDNNWSAPTDRIDAPYVNLPSGTYTFKLKACNGGGVWSEEYNYTFTIRPPWWLTWWAYIIYVMLAAFMLFSYVRWRTRSLTMRQAELQRSVNEATAEVKQQKSYVEEKHRELTDSMNYAERIQRSFLASEQTLKQNLREHFVFFRPKVIVSGDFYWAGKLVNGQFGLLCGDSTGHGVPGVIMSLLNIMSVEKVVETHSNPAEILNHTREIIIDRLRKDGSSEGGRDGMDCSFMSFDFKAGKLRYAGANNPIWIVRDNELTEVKPDRMPCGKHDRDKIPFVLQELDIKKGDMIYAFTDGMPDQFGGPEGKKYKNANLRKFLMTIHHLSPDEQRKRTINEFMAWKGTLEQVDDVTIMGIRI